MSSNLSFLHRIWIDHCRKEISSLRLHFLLRDDSFRYFFSSYSFFLPFVSVWMIIVGRKSCLILVLSRENTYSTYVLIFLHFFPFERSFQERKSRFFFRFYKLLIFLPSSLFLKKIRVFGYIAGVGKSCLLLRFSDDTFNTSFITTIGFVHIDPC